MKKNTEKNNKKIISENNNIPVENAASVEIKRKRGRPKKTENNNNLELKNKKNNNKLNKNNSGSIQANNINALTTSENNKNNSENNIIVQENGSVKKGRGRPKGTTGITRKDNIHNIVPIEVKQRLIQFNLVLSNLPKITEKNNPVIIQERTNYYFNLCSEYDIMPTIAGYALSLGIDRVTLWTWISGKIEYIKNNDVINILKNAYSIINNLYEEMLTEGKIVPVSAFFLMQNNHGYKQQTDHIITANTNDNVTDNDIYNRAALYD